MGLFLRTYFEDVATSAVRTASLDSFYRAAHDLRSPLSALNLTIHHFKKVSPHLDHLDLMDETLRRINSIAEEILRNRKLPEVARTHFDLPSALRSFAEGARFHFGSKVELCGFDDAFPGKRQVIGCKEDFQRVLWNLLENSSDANASRWVLAWNQSKDQITLKISDNGSGIPARILNSVGQKDFTTKKSGHGLGLYSSIQTLRSWAGDLRLTSQPNCGTTVEIQLTQS